MFSPHHHQLLQLHRTANTAPVAHGTTPYKRIVPEEIKPHKIAAIKKHIYDSKGITNVVKLLRKWTDHR